MQGVRGTGLALALFVTSPSGARAGESAPSEVSWQAPAQCPQQPAFVAEVERLLGQTLDARRDQLLAISAEVGATAGGAFRVELRVRTRSGTQGRTLTHLDCTELTEAAALVTALAIDPQLVVPEPAAETTTKMAPAEPGAEVAAKPAVLVPVPVAKSEVDTSPVSQRLADQPDSRAPEQPLHPSAAVLGLVGTATLPEIGLGVGALAALGPGRFRVALSGAYWLPRFKAIGARAGAGVDLGAWGVSVKACGLPLSGDVTLTACFGPRLGDMYGTGNAELENPTTAHQRWSTLEAELSLAISAKSGLTTLLGVELGKTLEAPRFGIEQNGEEVEVFEANAWILNGFVGLGQFL
jgi:hypothetical protein